MKNKISLFLGGSAKLESKHKIIEFTLWILGVMGVAIVVFTQNTIGGIGVITKNYLSIILMLSMILISLSLFLEIRRERKKRYFSIWNHIFKIIRSAVGLAIAMHYLLAANNF